MLKKINIILVCLFSCLTINYNIGFCLLIPILLFYIVKDIKNIYYTYIPSILFVTIFSFDNLLNLLYCLSIISVTYFIYRYISNRIKQEFKYMNIIYSCVLVLTNLTSYFLFKQSTNIFIITLFSVLSGLIYLYLDYFISKIVHNSNNYSILFLDVLLSLIAILGGLTLDIYNINFGLVISTYFMMYISRTYKDITSLVYSLFLVIIGFLFFKIEEFIFIPIISGMYLLKSSYVILPLNGILVISTLLLENVFDSEKLISIMATSILFEIVGMFVFENVVKDNDSNQTVYEKICAFFG